MENPDFLISIKRGSFMGENGFLADILNYKTEKMRSFFSTTIQELLEACREAVENNT